MIKVTPPLEEILSDKFKRILISDSEWDIFEYKTLNMHRAVLYWRPKVSFESYQNVRKQVRELVESEFKASWWRGFAFGTIVELASVPNDVENCPDDIDAVDNSKGTWQWSVLVFPKEKTVIGIHTWIQAFLTPIFEEIIQYYQSGGFRIEKNKKDKNALFGFLTSSGILSFPEYSDSEKSEG